MSRNYKEICKEIRNTGFFSEYLPPCFELNKKVFLTIPKRNCDLIKPYSFTMSKFNNNRSRRTIHIPEIGSYAVVHNYISEQNIIKELLEFTESNSKSFSHILMEDDSIMRHDQAYFINNQSSSQNSSMYISNITKKINRSVGAIKILKIDISNCYSSFYSHMIPAILLGYEKAEKEYENEKDKDNKGEIRDSTDEDYDTYIKYRDLDTYIRNQNSARTNGLLVGPLLSKIITEALLTRIDIELEQAELNFSRYVDDYEIYLYEDNEDQVINIVESVMTKYGFSLNDEKTEIVDFPFYIVENFDKIIKLYRDGLDGEYELIKLFNDFLIMEKNGTKGAVRYLLKDLERESLKTKKKDLLKSYLISVLSNDDRSLTKACSLLIQNNSTDELTIDDKKLLEKLLYFHMERSHDLEVLWLLYVLLETDNIKNNDKIIDDLIESNNELAIIMLLRKELLSELHKEKIKEKAKSWILNYELYADDLISEETLCSNLLLDKNKKMYQKMKERGIHFCYNSLLDEIDKILMY